jgi:HNH endonuclease
MSVICSVKECNSPLHVRDLCKKHYTRWQKYRDVNVVLNPRDLTTEQRFLRHVIKTKQCWIWIGSINEKGYGRFNLNGKCIRAHRVSYEIWKGKIHSKLYVLHTCDNRKCVNPKHLYLGDQLKNMDDMYKKKRNNQPKRENHPNSKLTSKKVKDIKKLLKSGMMGKDIALKYNLHKQTIYNINSGKIWNN